MKRIALVTLMSTTVALAVTNGMAVQQSGEDKFKEHCTACHVDGGNIIRPEKTLSRTDREKHGIKTADDIVRLMRNPGEGMSLFDSSAIPDKEAKEIADYIISTFK